MKLQTICNIKTLLTDSEDGPIAAFILPSSSQSKSSTYYCSVDIHSGQLTPGKGQSILAPSTALEMDWAAYRYGAWDNLNLKQTLLAKNKFVEFLKQWMTELPANNIKLYFGGDVTDGGEILCISKAAKQVPEKTIYMQTAHKVLLESVMKERIFAENIVLGIVPTRNKDMYTQLPVAYYTLHEGADELHTMPKDKLAKERVWKITSRYIDALESKQPLIESLLHV
jgi:hypothetical protein